ncbi:Gfo/Idh/MocA family oxidoreductase [Devosia rhodophyticola]|uniref:Gfo/Idh/MocA family oxidoreductase n=1 Tax=Devosia rhodophyticola TaxID=3026423 RepID=A0ABY7YX98_9HYPH|nr:Gfo/Idh/MocA family oxidoreductase [Devosia rhodophyticola]WDR06008.1 Gfo/Idh/MocA family oxidoreductase [Devosia rhodophyticola]
MNGCIGVAVIGAGFIGKVHAKCIHENPRTHLSAVYDVNTESAGLLAAHHSATCAVSLEEAIRDADVVIIGTPTVTHGEIARRCIENGTPFMCEKPLDTELQSAMRTAGMANQAGVFAGMGFNRRFDAQYQVLHQSIGNGDLGKVEIVLMTSRTQSLPSVEYVAKSGGQLRDKGAHWFDLLCWLTRERPREIFVQGSCLIDKRFADYGDVDTATIAIEMESGALCQMNFSRRTAYGYDERIEIAGSNGMMQSCLPIPVNVQHYHGNRITQGGIHPDWYSRIQGTYPAQLNALIDAIEGKGEFPSLVDGLVAEAIALAGTQSLEQRKPIPIPYDFDI